MQYLAQNDLYRQLPLVIWNPFISNDICFEHQPSGNHPERPDRLSAVFDGLKRARMGSTITKLSAEAVDENMVLQVHDQELISELKKYLNKEVALLMPIQG